MNYFALAGAILCGLIALKHLLFIITVSTGKRRYLDPVWGFTINAVIVVVTAPLAAWLLSVAIG